MTDGGHDWIVRADLDDVAGGHLRAARARLRSARERIGLPAHGAGAGARPGFARLAGRLLRILGGLLPWRRYRHDRDVAASLDRALDALQGSLGWQRARAEYSETLLAALARALPPRAWTGAAERPVILLGTGGGGTRVLAEAAARLGVFLGRRVNESFDSVEWAPLIYALVAEAGDDLERPRGASCRDRILQVAQDFRAPWASVGERWGWKIPEALLVLPPLLDALPEAQVVLLTRHPLPASLRRDHVTTDPGHPLGARLLPAAYRAIGRDPARIALDPQHVRNAAAWRFQHELARGQLSRGIAPERLLCVRLEDFALNPVRTGARLADFLGLPRPRRAELVPIDAERLRGGARDAAAAAEVSAISGPLAAELGYAEGWLEEACEEPGRRALFE